MQRTGLALAAALLLAVAAVGALQLTWTFGEGPPEAATGRRDVARVQTATAMVVAAHPLATGAGVAILRQGGSAIDAAVAIQAALTLVEPQSSGIGGGAFILHFDHAAQSLQAYDGRETAPAKSDPGQFLHGPGQRYTMFEAMVGGRSVGVPGALRALERAQRQHGRLAWRTLFAPAIRLCEEGFAITPRLARLAHFDPLLRTMPGARDYFYEPDGRARRAGTTLKNPALAQTLRAIADGGADAFYRGAIAHDIVAAVQGAVQPSRLETSIDSWLLKHGAPYGVGFDAGRPNPGALDAQDLATYAAKERAPLCRPYARWRVCTFGPPTSGGIAVLQVLAMVERFRLGQYAPDSAQAVHLIAEAERLAFADRDRYVADADFVDVPVAALLDTEYLESRAALIDPARATKPAKPGLPAYAQARADGVSPEFASTSHFSIVDAQRNVVSMTTSIEHGFGAHVMVDGFLLNNQLTDFSFDPGSAAKPIANALAPGKRPRSSMAPVIVFDAATGAPVLAVGSPGGSRIIGYVVRALLGVLEWQLDPQAAVDLPHFVNRNGATELENAGWPAGKLAALQEELAARGHDVALTEQNSGLHAIAIGADGLHGGADPRRDGLAAGW